MQNNIVRSRVSLKAPHITLDILEYDTRTEYILLEDTVPTRIRDNWTSMYLMIKEDYGVSMAERFQINLPGTDSRSFRV